MIPFLTYPHLSMNVPNFISNTVRSDIFYGDWDQQRISRLNVSVCPTMSRVPVRGYAVPYPTTTEMVQWVYSSTAIWDDQVGFLRNLNVTDQLWVETMLAHRTLTGRSRNDVVLPVDMSRLLDMGLYNPRDFRDTPPYTIPCLLLHC
jgi:hypothetical protein